MAKRFNVTGKCIAALHYMANVSGKFKAIMDMIDIGDYFIINRPRQYGKTTMLFQLTERLNHTEGYLALRTSFEGVGDTGFHNEANFCNLFFSLLYDKAKYLREDTLAAFLMDAQKKVDTLKELSEAISQLVCIADRKMVVLIDEVDKSSNNQLFLHFLGLLRDKYLDRDQTPTFHSVVLAGVHDVKILKLKLRPDAEAKLNSPWNIATDFRVDMNLQPSEIVSMLDDYAAERGVAMDARRMAEHLFYYTSGYPFLVSRLCKMLDEEMPDVQSRKNWTEDDLDQAVDLLVQESNVNFDEVVKNLENNPELYQLVEDMLITGEVFPFTIHDPIIQLGALYGIFANQNGLAIHNRIYREVIYNYMTLRAMRQQEHVNREFSGAYWLPGNRLDVERLLLRFQALLREEYSKKDRDFLERHGRLLFLAFLKPLLNGHGHAFKEPQISEEKRLDVVITYHQHKYVAELKVWRGPKAHKAGLEQLADYLDRQSLEAGYLIIFDHAETKAWETKRIRVKGKRIFAVWV